MNRSAWTGLFTGWLGLIFLHALSGKGASGRVGEFLNDVNSVVERVLDADVAAIPDLRAGASTTNGAGGGSAGTRPTVQ